MKNSSITLTENDRLILESYKTMIEGMADYLGSGYEFVLHSLENLNESVVKIINGHHTGRQVGAPITDLALSMLSKLQQEDEKGYISYNVKNKKGEPLKATTIAIKGENSKIIGVLCINFYLNTPLSEVLSNLSSPNATAYASETFVENVDELIYQAVSRVQKEVEMDESVPHLLKNKVIVTMLYNQGVFQFKDAVVKIAEILGISKNTVYMHLRAINSGSSK